VRVHIDLLTKPTQDSVRLLFSVADTGIGMDFDTQDRIFEPFVQAERVYVRNHQGAGLGLAIVQRLVHLLDGDVQLESNPGQGSVFYVSLPFVSQINEVPTPIRHDVARNKISGINILIVEDDSVNAFFIQAILKKMNAQTAVVGNGLEALHILEKEKFDVILMDVQMPIMDGLDATRRIRSGKICPDIPIIALTAYSMAGDEDMIMNNGVDAYIAKPVDLERLRESIINVLSRKITH
jgi:CheY-like chemotaxis protein